MKKLILSFFVVSLLAVLSISGNAQMETRYNANIPFDFSVGSKRFESGDYTITPLHSVTSLRALVLRSKATGESRTIGQVSINASNILETGKMIFTKAGNGWVLQTIDTGGFKLELRKSSKLNNADMASGVYSPETRSVAIGN